MMRQQPRKPYAAGDSQPPPSTTVEVVERHLAVIRTHRPLSDDQWATLRSLAHRLAEQAHAAALDLPPPELGEKPPELF